jgi:hypothetical protein
MGNDDFRNELNRLFDEVSGSPSPALSDRVRSAVTHAPEARGPYWIAAVAAGVIAVLIVGVLFVASSGRRSTGPVGAGLPSPSASASTSPAPSPTPTPSPSGAPFQCGINYGPVTQSGPVVATISDVRTGTHPGYDRITITFNNGAPANFEVRAQSNATFIQGASGQSVTLRGDSGLLVIIRGADAHTAYSGSTDFKTGYAKLVEARQMEDFEGTVQWGLGLSGSACYRVMVLTNPDRLVIDVQS